MDSWEDHIWVFDDGDLFQVCRHHSELETESGGIWDCTRATCYPALPARSRPRIVAHEVAYWLRVGVRFAWITATWWLEIARMRIFYPKRYRSWQAFLRGEPMEEA